MVSPSGTAHYAETGRSKNWIQFLAAKPWATLLLPVGGSMSYHSFDGGKTYDPGLIVALARRPGLEILMASRPDPALIGVLGQ